MTSSTPTETDAAAADRATDDGPLSDVVVVDLTHVLSGPFLTMTLADLGATVYKIERPRRGDMTRATPPRDGAMSAAFASVNRNKHSVTLDLKSERGRELLLELIAKADVLVHNFRPGTVADLGIDYEVVKALNPGIVYCEISGFGQSGPWRDRPAFDQIVQAASGIVGLTGRTGSAPVTAGMAIGDLAAPLFGAVGVLGALHARRRTGVGQHIDVSMFDALINLQPFSIATYGVTGQLPGRSGDQRPVPGPAGVLETTDGYVVISVMTNRFWRNLCAALERPAWQDDERFVTFDVRAANGPELFEMIQDIVRTNSTDHWCRRFDEYDIPHGEVAAYDTLFDEAHVRHREVLGTVEGEHDGEDYSITVPCNPIKYSSFTPTVRRNPPRLGADTESVLSEVVGLDADEIARLADEGVT